MLDFEVVKREAIPLLLELFEGYGAPVQRNGRVRCVVHDGVDGNVSIDRRNGLWKCHRCNAAGDAVELVRLKEYNALPKREGRTAALRQLAVRLGMDTGSHEVAPGGPFRPTPHPSPSPVRPEPVDGNLEALRKLENPRFPPVLYQHVLDSTALCDRAAGWLETRGLDPEAAFAYGFRSLPDSRAWDRLRMGIKLRFFPAEARYAGLYPDRLPWGGRVAALMIPYVFRGEVLAMRFRALSPTIMKRDRYRSLTGAPSLCLPFNADALTDFDGEEVHITEGELDCFTLASEYGLRAVGMPGTSPSKSLRERVAKALRPAGKVIAWYDPDAAGETVGWAGFRETLIAVNGAEWVREHVVRRRPVGGDVNDLHTGGGLGL